MSDNREPEVTGAPSADARSVEAVAEAVAGAPRPANFTLGSEPAGGFDRCLLLFRYSLNVHSRDVHPCYLVPRCPLPRFQSPLISIQQKSISKTTGLCDDNGNKVHIIIVQNEIANLCNHSGF